MQCWWPRESMLQGSSGLSEFRTSLSKMLTLWHCMKVKQCYLTTYKKVQLTITILYSAVQYALPRRFKRSIFNGRKARMGFSHSRPFFLKLRLHCPFCLALLYSSCLFCHFFSALDVTCSTLTSYWSL